MNDRIPENMFKDKYFNSPATEFSKTPFITLNGILGVLFSRISILTFKGVGNIEQVNEYVERNNSTRLMFNKQKTK